VSKTRVKVERITSLANDMALALATPSIRIEAPVPGKSVVGIEVPNTTTGLVTLRGVLESSSFQKLESRSKLAIALGRGSGGESVVADLSRMPHLLIAGATGSGKTVCLNSVIVSLLMYNTPQELQLLLIDPKRVELVSFDTVPHLASPVIVDSEKALGILRWANHEMDERYKRLADAGVRNIEGYNEKDGVDERMPYLVIAIDELADLMAYKAEEVESNICRLAQLARATGIHLVAATQRPSVDVVTGLIKANFPTRISFAVVSQVDSRAILDRGGAEKLLGRGDMLYLSTEAARPKRVQGCFVSDQEIERLVYFWGSQQVPDGRPWLIGDLAQTIGPAHDVGSPAADPLLEEARRLAREHKRISTSFLQRRLKIGYPRAARLMDLLEEEDAAGEQDEIS
jgi:S-DNA-T family DNA segregation ATPase FtsK/SpoIIIE